MPNKLETWQLWHAMKRHLGENFLIKALGKRNGRTIRLYSQDPKFTEDRCKDPLQALHIIFSELSDYGRTDVVAKSIDYLQSSLAGHVISPEAVACLKGTLSEEILADFSAVEALRKAIDSDQDSKSIATIKNLAVEEIERTFALYILQKKKKKKKSQNKKQLKKPALIACEE